MGDIIPPGTPVSIYRIERQIGWGGAAAVYEATDTKLKRRVALKVMSSYISNDPVFKKRFKRESWIHSNLEHPNIVTVYGADEHDEYGFWIAMRLMKGSLESQFKRSEPLDPEHVIDLLTPIAAALDFAHERGQVHRDVKPENILLGEDDVPYLTDFGIAKSIDGSRLTLTGQGIGTPGYVAPEQIAGKRVDRRADVYSLSVVLFRCLTGEVPLPKANGITRGRLRITRGIPTASERNPMLPEAIDPVIRKGMEKRRRKRYTSATALIGEAREALAEAASQPSRSTASGARWRLRGALFAGVAVLALGVLGLGLGAATEPSPPSPPKHVATESVGLHTPHDWIRGNGPAVSGLGIVKPVNFESPPASEGGPLSVSAGLSPVTGASLLPSAYRSQLSDKTPRARVDLGSLQAYRYSLETPATNTPVTIFASPTTRGVAMLACRMPEQGADRSAARLCSRIASTLVLRKGTAYALGPSPAFAKALRLRLAKLKKRLVASGSELESADDASSQASDADDIADAFHVAAKGLGAVRISPESVRGQERLVSALRSTRDAYQNLAVAARQEDQSRYGKAAAAVAADEVRVRAAIRGLSALGYRTPSSIPGRTKSTGA